MPDQPTDQFKGAEESVDKQRMDALNALATFGRRGLDAAVARKTGINTEANQAHLSAGHIPGIDVPEYGQAELAGITDRAYGSYQVDAAKAAANLNSEMNALQQVQGNYYNQVRQAVPLYRTNAQTVTDQYRKNYEERQAEIARQQQALEEQRTQALLAIQMQQEAMAQQAQIHAAQMAAIGAAGGGGGGSAGGQYGPDILTDEQAQAAADAFGRATAEAMRQAQAQTAYKNLRKKTGRGGW